MVNKNPKKLVNIQADQRLITLLKILAAKRNMKIQEIFDLAVKEWLSNLSNEAKTASQNRIRLSTVNKSI